MIRRSCALALVAATSMGCAAIFKGSHQDVTFGSVPDRADVRIDNRYVGATPVQGSLSRNQSQNVVVSKDGFAEQHVQIQRSPDAGWWVWDITTCVIPIMLCIPLLVDAISGAWLTIDNDVRVKLEPVREPPRASPRLTTPAPTSSSLGF